MGGMDWIDLAQYRDKWRVIVNAVMNLPSLSHAGNFSASRGAVTVCCAELVRYRVKQTSARQAVPVIGTMY